MRYLCLAYGREEPWLALPRERRDELLAADDELRRRGALVAVLGEATVVRAWDGTPQRSSEPYAEGAAPLVGFSIVEAGSLDEVVDLVAGTPCAVARGAIEIRPIVEPEGG